MKRVILESPFAGKVRRNIIYARRCVRDSLLRGEAPIASHLLYTQKGILNDHIPGDRIKGIEAGLEWQENADIIAIYEDYGISDGMLFAMNIAFNKGKFFEYRCIGKNSNSLKRFFKRCQQYVKI